MGRCDAYATEFDLEAEEYVPLPKVLPLPTQELLRVVCLLLSGSCKLTQYIQHGR